MYIYMKKLISKHIWLWPTNWLIVLVITKTDNFSIIPKLGFYGNEQKTYFILGFGRTLAGVRTINQN